MCVYTNLKTSQSNCEVFAPAFNNSGTLELIGGRKYTVYPREKKEKKKKRRGKGTVYVLTPARYPALSHSIKKYELRLESSSNARIMADDEFKGNLKMYPFNKKEARRRLRGSGIEKRKEKKTSYKERQVKFDRSRRSEFVAHQLRNGSSMAFPPHLFFSFLLSSIDCKSHAFSPLHQLSYTRLLCRKFSFFFSFSFTTLPCRSPQLRPIIISRLFCRKYVLLRSNI